MAVYKENGSTIKGDNGTTIQRTDRFSVRYSTCNGQAVNIAVESNFPYIEFAIPEGACWLSAKTHLTEKERTAVVMEMKDAFTQTGWIVK